MNPKTTSANQDETFATTEGEMISTPDEVLEANDSPDEDIEDTDDREDDDDVAGQP